MDYDTGSVEPFSILLYFICGSFYDTVCSSDYIALNAGKINV